MYICTTALMPRLLIFIGHSHAEYYESSYSAHFTESAAPTCVPPPFPGFTTHGRYTFLTYQTNCLTTNITNTIRNINAQWKFF